MLKFIVTALFVHAVVSAVDPEQFEAAREQGDAALAIAENSLSGTGFDYTGSGGGPCFSRSTVKFNSLTEELSFNSNRNLLTYDTLRKQGVPSSSALGTLSSSRPAFCTRNPPTCDPNERFRKIDGTCNNLEHPFWGSVNTEILRLLPAAYSDGISIPRGGDGTSTPFTLPNPRLLSTTIHPDILKPDVRVTNMLPVFGQFLDHDISLSPEGGLKCCSNPIAAHPDWFPIQIFSNDTFYSKLTAPQTCMDFTRSTAFCFPTETGVREQMNILTHYMDASNIYGSDEKRSSFIRSFDKGKLRSLSSNPKLLPTNSEVEALLGEKPGISGTFLAGDNRVNEMPLLTAMHTLWFREHNRLAEGIFQRMPSWSDERIFQETRRLVIAEWQNVVYGEYLPALLGSTAMSKYGLSLKPYYSTYSPTTNPGVFHAFSDAAYRFGHTFINGLVQLFDGMQQTGQFRVRDNFFVPNQLTQDGGKGYNRMLDGMLRQNSQSFDRFVTEDLTNFVLRAPTEEFGADLIARNIHRGRDHGLPGWMKFRELCGLDVSSAWTIRLADVDVSGWDKLSTLYANVGDVDLFTGGLLEIPASGALTGRTFNCLKAMQFKRLKDGDRFFFTHGGQVGSFTEAQILKIRARTLGDIICENSDVVQTQKNVFLTRDSTNLWIPCNSANRAKLELAYFVD